ncbi:hypothetical protein HO173_009266 [Letharia columbiana]|uniref:Uncharacterized protein n=1 Tax=Letharia columbiana TaxID=112416 RepID=A0A8H6L209_9LECA|nr:uncharacterized protein HO173_009266 [Letharia columbiana]KAF6232598.1 hypothetical protein HO173_009266 [Letharia columbiana]
MGQRNGLVTVTRDKQALDHSYCRRIRKKLTENNTPHTIVSLLQWRREQTRQHDYDSTSSLSMSTTHTVSLLQWQQTYDLFTEHVDNTHSEPATKWHSTHSILPSLLPPYQTLRIDECMSLRKWSMSVRSLAAEYSLWQLRTGTWDWQLRTGRPTGYWQSKRVRGTGSRSGRLTRRMDAMDSTTKQDGYELRQRRWNGTEDGFLMARAWETQGKSTVKLPGQAASRC